MHDKNLYQNMSIKELPCNVNINQQVVPKYCIARNFSEKNFRESLKIEIFAENFRVCNFALNI